MAEDGFTAGEIRLMRHAWQCMETEPKINYEKLAEAMGMSNVRSASNAWGKLKSKLKFSGDEGAGTPKSAGKTTAKKRGKGAMEDDNESTPGKKAKKQPKAKATEIKKEVIPGMDELDEELLASTHDSDEDIADKVEVGSDDNN